MLPSWLTLVWMKTESRPLMGKHGATEETTRLKNANAKKVVENFYCFFIYEMICPGRFSTSPRCREMESPGRLWRIRFQGGQGGPDHEIHKGATSCYFLFWRCWSFLSTARCHWAKDNRDRVEFAGRQRASLLESPALLKPLWLACRGFGEKMDGRFFCWASLVVLFYCTSSNLWSTWG